MKVGAAARHPLVADREPGQRRAARPARPHRRDQREVVVHPTGVQPVDQPGADGVGESAEIGPVPERLKKAESFFGGDCGCQKLRDMSSPVCPPDRSCHFTPPKADTAYSEHGTANRIRLYTDIAPRCATYRAVRQVAFQCSGWAASSMQTA